LKSVLPPAFEAARVRIARTHNQLIVLLLVLFIGTLFGLLRYAPDLMQEDPLKPLLVVVAVEFALILALVRFDRFQCRRLGYMCPQCGKPLYESRSMFYLDGICPKCKHQIFKAAP
jgi:hypothetical protein